MKHELTQLQQPCCKYDENAVCHYQAEILKLRQNLDETQKKLDFYRVIDRELVVGAWEWGFGPMIERWSYNVKRLLGYTEDELPGFDFEAYAKISYPGYGDAIAERAKAHILKGEPYRWIMKYRHRDGSPRWFWVHAKAPQSNGKIKKMIGVNVDVTELVEALIASGGSIDLETGEPMPA